MVLEIYLFFNETIKIKSNIQYNSINNYIVLYTINYVCLQGKINKNVYIFISFIANNMYLQKILQKT